MSNDHTPTLPQSNNPDQLTDGGAGLISNGGPARPDAPHRFRIIVVSMFLLIGLSGLLAAILRARTADVRLLVNASEIKFVSATSKPITGLEGFSSMRATNIKAVVLPAARGVRERSTEANQIYFSAQESAGIALPPLFADTGSSVVITHDPAMRARLRVTIEQSPSSLRPAFQGPITVQVNDGARTRLRGSNSAATVIHHGALDLEVTAPASARNWFQPSIPVRDIAFVRPDLGVNGAVPSHFERQSTLRALKIQFIGVDKVERDYPVTHPVDITFSDTATLRALDITSEDLQMEVVGRVERISVAGQNEMPTYLRVLMARDDILFLISTLTGIAAAALGALRWWRNPK